MTFQEVVVYTTAQTPAHSDQPVERADVCQVASQRRCAQQSDLNSEADLPAYI